MNLKIRFCIGWVAALVTLVPCIAQAFTSVRLFGASGTGFTDDTAAINAAIAAGTAVYFPPGIYKYTGSMTLPANTSYRLYGDGPGVSTIQFTGPISGINASNMGQATLNVDGLTLQANSRNCGTAITAMFSESNPAKKFRTVTIHNVTILGSTGTGSTGFYWTNGIYLYKAQNAVIDKVEISGNTRDDDPSHGPPTQTGIVWESSNDYATTGLQLSNLDMKWCNTALRTNGWVEGLYLTGFEFVLCGQQGMPAVDLNTFDSVNRKPAFHLYNGHVDAIENGIRLTNIKGAKLSNLLLLHNSAAAIAGSIVALNNCTDAIISHCTFFGVNPANQEPDVASETGILLNNAHQVRIAGNFFSNMLPTTSGSCISVQANSNLVRITDNLFGDLGGGIRQRYIDAATDTYYRGNN